MLIPRVAGNVTVVSLEHPAKAYAPMDFTPSGTVSDVMSVPENAPSATAVIPLGKV